MKLKFVTLKSVFWFHFHAKNPRFELKMCNENPTYVQRIDIDKKIFS